MVGVPVPLRAILALSCVALICRAAERPPVHHLAIEVEPRDAALALAISVDVWTEHAAAGEPIVVVVTPAGLAVLAAAGIRARVVTADIEADADRERARLAHRDAAAWFAAYRDLGEVNAYLDGLRVPDLATVRELGTSIEGRPIRAIEISRGGTIGIVLDGGQHAREWISVMVPVCIADRLVRASDARTRRILEAVRFTIVPVVNPDGYAYTWSDDRYWRKNRRGGHGVDLNRNYSVAWGEAGSSAERRSPNYRGEAAFSEPETQAMRALFDRERIAAHVDFHSYSQVIVYPWSHRREPPADRAAFAAIADRMTTAMRAAHGEVYKIRPGSELQTGAGGTLGDWAYAEKRALSFLVELRPPPGGNGFVLPPEQIVPTCDESLAAVLALAESMISAAR